MGENSGAGASRRETAYAYLRDHILVDARMQGKFINEQELAAQIGVSRTPVREALLLLASDGLVKMIPQRGALIPVITGREIAELMEMRSVLECHAARVTILANTVPLQAMADTLARQVALDGDVSPESARVFITLDTRFHQLLVDAVGNDLMSRTYSKLRVRQILVGVEALFRTRDRQQHVCEEHATIVDALRMGDWSAAQAAIEHHLLVTLDILARA